MIKKNGWREVRQKGSHKIMRKEASSETIIFPYHRGKEVPTGTARRIMKQAGIK